MTSDFTSVKPHEQNNTDAAALLPDMSRFEPASIGAWECIWNSPFWFTAERDLDEGERVSVAIISDVSGSVLCRQTFIARGNGRLKENWLVAFADQINGDNAVTPWLRAGYLDGRNVFHDGPLAGVLRLWSWGGNTRIVCTAPFTGNLQPTLALPDVAIDDGQTLWLQARDRATQRVCETLTISISGSNWQEAFCRQVNSESQFLRAGLNEQNAPMTTLADRGSSIRIPLLAGMTVTLDVFAPGVDSLTEEPSYKDVPMPYIQYKKSELADPLRYARVINRPVINKGEMLYLPVTLTGSGYADTNAAQQKSVTTESPAPVSFVVCCKINETPLKQNVFFTGADDFSYPENLNNYIPNFKKLSSLIPIQWLKWREEDNNRYMFSEGLDKFLDSGGTMRWFIYSFKELNPIALLNLTRNMLEGLEPSRRGSTRLQGDDRESLLSNFQDIVTGGFIRYDKPSSSSQLRASEYLPVGNFLKYRSIKQEMSNSFTIVSLLAKAYEIQTREIDGDYEDDEFIRGHEINSTLTQYYQLGSNVGVYCLPPFSGVSVGSKSNDKAIPFSAVVVSRQLVTHALPLNNDGYVNQQRPLSKVTSTLCEDAAFTLRSEVFDISGETENGVDPMSGLYHAHYPLAMLQSISDPRVRLDLSLHYAATRANEGALGDGWAFRLTSFDNRERRLNLHRGLSVTLTDDDMTALAGGEAIVKESITLTGTLAPASSITFPVLATLTVTFPDGEFVNLGAPDMAEESGKAFKSNVVSKLQKVNINLKRQLKEQEDIIEKEQDYYWHGIMKETGKKSFAKSNAERYSQQIKTNERNIELLGTNAMVLVPLRIGRANGGSLSLEWKGRMGHVRLLSVKDGATELFSAVHEDPVASGTAISTFTVWPGTSEAHKVRLEIEDCLLKTVTRLPTVGDSGQRISFSYCNDPLFDRLLDSVTGETGSREYITWKAGHVLPDGSWTLPEVLTRTRLPGGGGEAMQESWRWRGYVSLKAHPGSRRIMTHVATDGTETVREWEYTDAGPRLVSVIETRSDGTGRTTTSQYRGDAQDNTAAHEKRQAVRTTVTPHKKAAKA